VAAVFVPALAKKGPSLRGYLHQLNSPIDTKTRLRQRRIGYFDVTETNAEA
jgi:hypothetical protein